MKKKKEFAFDGVLFQKVNELKEEVKAIENSGQKEIANLKLKFNEIFEDISELKTKLPIGIIKKLQTSINEILESDLEKARKIQELERKILSFEKNLMAELERIKEELKNWAKAELRRYSLLAGSILTFVISAILCIWTYCGSYILDGFDSKLDKKIEKMVNSFEDKRNFRNEKVREK